jgi:hypothetical protein
MDGIDQYSACYLQQSGASQVWDCWAWLKMENKSLGWHWTLQSDMKFNKIFYLCQVFTGICGCFPLLTVVELLLRSGVACCLGRILF